METQGWIKQDDMEGILTFLLSFVLRCLLLLLGHARGHLPGAWQAVNNISSLKFEINCKEKSQKSFSHIDPVSSVGCVANTNNSVYKAKNS